MIPRKEELQLQIISDLFLQILVYSVARNNQLASSKLTRKFHGAALYSTTVTVMCSEAFLFGDFTESPGHLSYSEPLDTRAAVLSPVTVVPIESFLRHDFSAA